MKKFIATCLLLFTILVVWAQQGDLYDLYIGTFTTEGAEGIYHCQFNAVEGELSLKQVFKGIDSPNFLKVSADGKYLYAATRAPGKVDPSGGAVTSFVIKGDRSLEFLSKQSSHGDDPCYIDISKDGKWVVTSNYGGGSVALFPVNSDGSLFPASSVIRHEGSGPNPARQTKTYAHSIRFSEHNEIIYAADLGADKLFAYTLNKVKSSLVPANPPFAQLPPGSGPRHFEFSKGGQYCYVVNELSSTVTVFTNEKSVLREVQTISTLPAGFTGTSFCADIHLSPDGKYLYASNRGHNSIAVFRVMAGGKVEMAATVPVEGNWPRNFTLDPTGNYMLVANQRSHNITLFRIKNGIPEFTGKSLEIPAPVCIAFMPAN